MDTSAFLSLILPTQGLYVVALPQEKTNEAGKKYVAWKHQTFSTISGMSDWLLAADAAGQTVYHGCGSLKAKFITTDDGKKRIRTFDNIAFCRSFWLDIDVGEGKDYATKGEALTALQNFLKKTRLPTPLMIDSGGGIHCYWPLDRDMSADLWKSLADRFKNLCNKLGLKSDPARTSDACSILRPVGSTNRKDKYGPAGLPVRPAKNADDIKPIPYAKWLEKLTALEQTHKIALPKVSTHSLFDDGSEVKKLGVGLSENIEIPSEINPSLIVTGCNQFKQFCESKGAVTEPYWYAAIQLVRFFKNGREEAHKLSAGHPQYDESETDAKLDNLEEKQVGPTLCEKFGSVNPGGCDKCEFKGQIKSPIVLGRVFTSAPAPEITIGGKVVSIPNPPAPYVRSENGAVIIERSDAQGGPLPPHIIYPYDLYPIARVYDTTHREDTVLWQVHTPLDGIREFMIPLKSIYEKFVVAEILAKSGVVVGMGKPLDMLLNYVIAYICKLQETTKSVDFVARMGWQGREDDQFVLGYTGHMADGRALPVPTSLMQMNVAADRYVDCKGDLEEWKRVVGTYNRVGQEPFAFGFLSAFGSVIFKFTGFDGAIVSIIDDGGTGKTTMQQAILSVYGNPENKDVLITPQDTEKTVIAKLAALSNLPIILDDFSGTDEKDTKALADLCYAVSQGKGRDRLNQDGSISDRRERWSTIGVLSSNRSVYTRLHGYRGQATAESMRVLEYMGPNRETLDVTPAEARELFRGTLPQHYGHAGRKFVAYVVQHIPEVRARLIAKMKEIEDMIGERSSERYWLGTVAANIVGGEIAYEIGVSPIVVQPVFEWILARVVSAREKVLGFKSDSVGFISEFIHNHLDQIAVLNYGKIQNTLRGKIVGRVDKDKNTMFLAVSELRKHATQTGVDMDSVVKDLRDNGILKERTHVCRLTAGTGIHGGSVNTWKLDISKQAFSGEFKPEMVIDNTKKAIDTTKKVS